MNDNNLINLGQISQFLAGSREVEFKPVSLKDRYRWIAKTLLRLDYCIFRSHPITDSGNIRSLIPVASVQ